MQRQWDKEGPALSSDSDALSASLEDYLEAILLLERSSRVARVSEIAEQLKVSRPSVTSALKNLGARGLVLHARYGHVTLTAEGTRIALGVERRHVAIREFLTGVLSIPEELAEVSACRLEHVLESEVLAHFVSYAENHGAAQPAHRPGDHDGDGEGRDMTWLSLLPAGSRAVVSALPSSPGLAKRLIALGLTPGAVVKVLQNRGRGPLLIEVHCSRLALGWGQAAKVAVRPVAADEVAAEVGTEVAVTPGRRPGEPGEDG